MASQQLQDTKQTVAVVSGGNRGIGLEIVKGLASAGMKVVLTARNVCDGKAVVRMLKTQHGLRVFFHQLDVTDPNSISGLAAWLTQQFGGLDILVSNAGISPPPSPLDVTRATTTLNTNYYGSKRLIQVLTPLLRPLARIIIVSSSAGRINVLRDQVAKNWMHKLSNAEETLSEESIECFVQDFLNDLGHGTHIEKGWPIKHSTLLQDLPIDDSVDYVVSKMALNAYARVLALKLGQVGVYVNCFCPGLTSTNMSFQLGHPVDIGADTAIWLALLPHTQLSSGKFYVRRQDTGYVDIPLAFYDGYFGTNFASPLHHACLVEFNSRRVQALQQLYDT